MEKYTVEQGKAISALNKVFKQSEKDKVGFKPTRFNMFSFKAERQEIHKIIFKAAKIDFKDLCAHEHHHHQ